MPGEQQLGQTEEANELIHGNTNLARASKDPSCAAVR
ncbi:hypothetical protein [Streptomyces sp. NPDC052015]